MEITFKNTVRDIFSFNLSHSLRSPINIFVNVLCIIFFSRHAIEHCVKSGFSASSVLGLIFYVLVFIILFYLFTCLFLFLSIAGRKNKNHLLEKTMTFSADEINLVFPYGKSTFQWGMIPKIKENNKYILIYTAANAAYIIPKRIFASKAAAANFSDYIYATWKGYKL